MTEKVDVLDANTLFFNVNEHTEMVLEIILQPGQGLNSKVRFCQLHRVTALKCISEIQMLNVTL